MRRIGEGYICYRYFLYIKFAREPIRCMRHFHCMVTFALEGVFHHHHSLCLLSLLHLLMDQSASSQHESNLLHGDLFATKIPVRFPLLLMTISSVDQFTVWSQICCVVTFKFLHGDLFATKIPLGFPPPLIPISSVDQFIV